MNWQCPSLSLSHGLTRSLYRKFMSRPSTFTQSPALQFYLFSLFCVASTEILWIKPISGQENLRSKELHPIWNAISLLKTATHFWPCWQSYSQFHQPTCCWNLSGRVIANKLWIFKSLDRVDVLLSSWDATFWGGMKICIYVNAEVLQSLSYLIVVYTTFCSGFWKRFLWFFMVLQCGARISNSLEHIASARQRITRTRVTMQWNAKGLWQRVSQWNATRVTFS